MQLLEKLDQPLTAPALFPAEVTSLLLKAIRAGRVKPSQRDTTVRLAERFVAQVELVPISRPSRVIGLAEQHGLSAHDAAYLSLALERSLQLLSIDGRLHRVSIKLGVAA